MSHLAIVLFVLRFVMRWPSVAILIALATYAPAGATVADGGGAPSIQVPQLPGAPPLDASLGGAWSAATTLHLAHEATYRRAASEDTVVRIGMYRSTLYVAFEAKQREAQVATQVTDGTGVLAGDAVMVHLWPDGLSGFAYWFATNAHGARDQFSSENASYAPVWTAFGGRTKDGYIAILKIPLSAMHVTKAGSWRAQFHRMVVASNSNDVWELDPEQASFIDPRYGGQLLGMTSSSHAAMRPRLQVYALSALSSAAGGGDTSRLGADVSIPVTATTSIFGTVHPDYSNVEIDQQTIAPAEFARRFSEVRPFFTQAAANFDQQSDFNAPMSTLYTPAIPTFRDGFGVEGHQGTATFGAFNAAGANRDDNALAVTATDTRQELAFFYQRVGTDVTSPGAAPLRDLVDEESISLFNPHSHLTFFANDAEESGSAVTGAGGAQYQDVGGTYSTATTVLGAALQRMGAQFDPVDGYANQPPGEPGVGGYTVYASRQIDYSSSARILDVAFSGDTDLYHGPNGGVNQADFSDQVRFDFKDLLSLSAMQDVSSLQTCAPLSPASCRSSLLPYNGGGLTFGYAANTANPSSISYMTGRYYHGSLVSWLRSFAIPLVRRTALLLEGDDTVYRSSVASEPNSKQWLERVSVNYQLSSTVSADVGVRRIVGTNQPFAFSPFGPSNAFGSNVCAHGSTNVVYATTNGCLVDDDATNLSVAVHFFRGNNEVYIVYGDPNQLTTQPSFFMKFVRYVGAGKGQ